MSLHPWPHLLKRIRKGSPLLGLDVGTKTIGIAISDPVWRQAAPLVTIERTKLKADLEALAALAKERGARGFLIGLPLNMDGSEGGMARYLRDFARLLLEHRNLFAEEPEIALVDERLSTAAMEDFLRDNNVSQDKRDAAIDKLAAQVILQGALDQMNRSSEKS